MPYTDTCWTRLAHAGCHCTPEHQCGVKRNPGFLDDPYYVLQGRLLDGKVIDSSLSRDPLVVELGKRTVIAGLEQSLLGVCVGQKIKATIPAHLGYGKRGYPPTIPGDSALEFEVEVVSLTQKTPWQHLVNDVFPMLCLVLVPTLLGLVGLYLYKKASAQGSSKKVKDKKSKQKKK
ncbi:FK506-binding protein 11 precursor-like [Arapaima gigas]